MGVLEKINHVPHNEAWKWLPFWSQHFLCFFLNEAFCVLIQISMKFVLKNPTDNKSALVQVMALLDNKLLPESLMIKYDGLTMGWNSSGN